MRTQTNSRLALLLHPVRIRLVNAMSAGRTLSTAELCARLPDLPKATVYRHVERLLRGGVFEVDSEQRKRGAVERRYRLALRGHVVEANAAKQMTLEDHRNGFTAALGALIADFNAYLDRGDADPIADCVSYRQFTLWLSPRERSRLIADITQLLFSCVTEPGAGRTPHLLSTIFFPTGSAPKARKKNVSRGAAHQTAWGCSCFRSSSAAPTGEIRLTCPK